MEYRTLGKTGIRVSAIAFGAGPVSQLLTGDETHRQNATVEAAVAAGVNWFDTAATYGDGRSEANLAKALEATGLSHRVQIATKVRVMPHELDDISGHVRRSVQASLARLNIPRITLLQIHNSITSQAGAQPTSITPAHVLAAGGMLETFDRLQQAGLVEHFGLTGIGEPAAFEEVIASRRFATIQIPYNVLNASAGRRVSVDFAEVNYGDLMTTCQRYEMGVFVIRALAGGALAGQEPSPHTLKTPFFPLDLYQRDQRRAEQVRALLPAAMTLKEAAVRFTFSHPAVTSAIVGCGSPDELNEIVGYAAAGPLDAALLGQLHSFS